MNTVHTLAQDIYIRTDKVMEIVLFVCSIILLVVGAFSVWLESRLVAPDVLGYVSTTVRNSKFLKLPEKVSSGMSGAERAFELRKYEVMMQDVKKDANRGKIALGVKHEGAEPLKRGRIYRY